MRADPTPDLPRAAEFFAQAVRTMLERMTTAARVGAAVGVGVAHRRHAPQASGATAREIIARALDSPHDPSGFDGDAIDAAAAAFGPGAGAEPSAGPAADGRLGGLLRAAAAEARRAALRIESAAPVLGPNGCQAEVRAFAQATRSARLLLEAWHWQRVGHPDRRATDAVADSARMSLGESWSMVLPAWLRPATAALGRGDDATRALFDAVAPLIERECGHAQIGAALRGCAVASSGGGPLAAAALALALARPDGQVSLDGDAVALAARAFEPADGPMAGQAVLAGAAERLRRSVLEARRATSLGPPQEVEASTNRFFVASRSARLLIDAARHLPAEPDAGDRRARLSGLDQAEAILADAWQGVIDASLARSSRAVGVDVGTLLRGLPGATAAEEA